jgi:prepilin-type N-terminal cleavage/methylation domain-containing protein/prepilin-type processing-associated H-X9-DG protein
MLKTTRILPHAKASGFTLTELLVVIAIIAVVAGLVVPSLTYARFRSKGTVCSNNYRQWGISVGLYAADDGKGRLPSFALPVNRMAQYSSIEPWFVALEMITNMAPHGVTVPMWFCPTRAYRLKLHQGNFRVLRGREMSTPADLVDEYANVQKAAFAGPDLFWWVPRRLGDSSLSFPDPKLLKTRLPDAWPSRMDDPTISTMPFISDWTVGEVSEDGLTRTVTGGGHAWPAMGRSIKSSNSGFADGHVETRSKEKLQWQVEGRRGYLYFY